MKKCMELYYYQLFTKINGETCVDCCIHFSEKAADPMLQLDIKKYTCDLCNVTIDPILQKDEKITNENETQKANMKCSKPMVQLFDEEECNITFSVPMEKAISLMDKRMGQNNMGNVGQEAKITNPIQMMNTLNAEKSTEIRKTQATKSKFSL